MSGEGRAVMLAKVAVGRCCGSSADAGQGQLLSELLGHIVQARLVSGLEMVSDLSALVLNELRHRVEVFAGLGHLPTLLGELPTLLLLGLVQGAKGLMNFEEFRA